MTDAMNCPIWIKLSRAVMLILRVFSRVSSSFTYLPRVIIPVLSYHWFVCLDLVSLHN